LTARLAFKESVEKDLRRIGRVAAGRVLSAIESDLILHPGKHKRLTGQFSGLYSFRIGEWRVIYSIQGETILVLRVAHRKNAYRP
jgi:mRNA interferase RelE/StbE